MNRIGHGSFVLLYGIFSSGRGLDEKRRRGVPGLKGLERCDPCVIVPDCEVELLHGGHAQKLTALERFQIKSAPAAKQELSNESWHGANSPGEFGSNKPGLARRRTFDAVYDVRRRIPQARSRRYPATSHSPARERSH